MNLKFAMRGLMVAGLAIGSTQAAVLYSDNFSGDSSANLHGTTPDTAIGANTWIAHENWKADGSIAVGSFGSDHHNAYLPFVPEAGRIYTLTATLEKPTGPDHSGVWAAIGFTDGVNGTVDSGSFFPDPNNAGPWMLYRADQDQIAAFAGPGTAGGSGNLSTYTGTQTLSIVLNTREPEWTAEWFVGEDSVYTFEYEETNPTISYVGLGRNNGAETNFSAFEVSVFVIPEPSTAGLLVLGLAAAAAALRRRFNR